LLSAPKVEGNMRPALIALVFVVVGCANRVEPRPVEGDDAPEAVFNADELDAAFVVEDDALVSPVLSLATGANRVALMLTLKEIGETPAVRVRGVMDNVAGPWSEATWTFDESGYYAGVGHLDDIYIDVQIAVDQADADRIDSLTFAPAYAEEGVEVVEGQGEQGLAAELAFVGVQPRSAWGARAHRCSTRDSDFYRMALHHTAARATANVELALRQAQSYHMDGRGYCDIAYHFAVAQDGRVFELRPMPFRGGHTLNNNTGNIGIVFVGCFDGACGNDQPSDQLMGSGAGIVAMLSQLEGIEINSDRVRGHRDHSGAQTACPGANLHPRLEEIRAGARNILSGPPAPPPPPPPEGCGVVTPGTMIGPGEGRHSCDGRFFFVHQNDGNVVLYQNGTPLWATGTNGRSTSALVMQNDGNLVLYSGGNALWASGTHGHNGAWLGVQSDGNVVIYSGASPLGATNTCCR
jgi:hypothetical protein